MAIFYEGMTCILCEKEMDDHMDLFATSGVFFPEEHPLEWFCDRAMHWDCYERWPDRIEFAHGYFQMWVEAEQDNPYWGKAFLSEKVFVSVNPGIGVAEVAVLLAETGSDIRVPLILWNIWIRSRWMAERGLHSIEKEALREVWPLLRDAFPHSGRLVEAVDWTAKKQVLDRHKERYRQREEERMRRPRIFNKACRSLVRKGVTCPYCNSADVQYIDRSPQAKSSFLCSRCKQSFGPVEVSIKSLYG